MDANTPDPSTIGSWLGHIVSLFAIGGSLFGVIPAIAAILAVIWYALEIYDNKNVQRWVRARRLRKLVKLRAAAVALELAIRNHDGELSALNDANQVHQAASGKAAELTHDALMVEQKKVEGERIEKALGLTSTLPR